MVKQPTSESSEFTMSSEDFPALPGSEITPGGNSVEKTTSEEGSRLAVTQATTTTATESTTSNPKPPQPPKRGIQTSPDGWYKKYYTIEIMYYSRKYFPILLFLC